MCVSIEYGQSNRDGVGLLQHGICTLGKEDTKLSLGQYPKFQRLKGT